MDHKDIKLKDDVIASIADRKINTVRQAVLGMIKFIIISFEELGIDKLHEIADPSLDEIVIILDLLAEEVETLEGKTDNLKQAIRLAQIMVNDVKQKNSDLCATGAKILKTVSVD